MAKKPRGLARIDHDALLRSVTYYKKISRECSVELSELILRTGWRAGAIYAARRLQQISLGLGQFEAAPCELREKTVGGVRKLWFADPDDPLGADSRRPEMCLLLKRLLFHRLSR